jgi:hypothetical protein
MDPRQNVCSLSYRGTTPLARIDRRRHAVAKFLSQYGQAGSMKG